MYVIFHKIIIKNVDNLFVKNIKKSIDKFLKLCYNNKAVGKTTAKQKEVGKCECAGIGRQASLRC